MKDDVVTSRLATVLSGVFGDDFAVLPNVDGCAETTSRSAGIQSGLLKSASHAFGEFLMSSSSIHEFAGRCGFPPPFCLNFRISPRRPQVVDR